MNRILLFTIIALLFARCTEDKKGPLTVGGDMPAQIKNIVVSPTPGGALITYDIPSDENLLYVRADYTLQTGEEKNVIVSGRVNNLSIEGLQTMEECTVQIYSVSYSEVKSAAQEIKFVPLKSPLESVYETIKMEPTFGGVKLKFQNPMGASFKASIVIYDSISNKYVDLRDIYTQMIDANFNIRKGEENFDPLKYGFGVYLRDRWNNKSDTLFLDIEPWEEYLLDRSNWGRVDLYDKNDPIAQVKTAAERPIGQTKNRDYTTNYSDDANPVRGRIENMWDGKYTTSGTSNSGATEIFQTAYHGLPLNFCFSLGQRATISRLKLHPRIGNMSSYVDAWGSSDIKSYEVWGCDDLDTDDWGWEQWTLLRTVDMADLKPSGLPFTGDPSTTYTQEDKDMAYAGYEIEITDCPPVKYLRFNVKETWNPAAIFFQINELFAYGIPLDN